MKLRKVESDQKSQRFFNEDVYQKGGMMVEIDGIKCFAAQGGGQTRGGLDRMRHGPHQGPSSHMQSCPIPQVLAPLY